MFYFSSLAVPATQALASSLLAGPQIPPDTEQSIARCEKSSNCEVYTTPSTGGRNIRFKNGMEPGSADHKIRSAKTYAKRDDGYPKTDVTVGDATIMWGCDVDPVSMLNQLINCVTNAPYTEDVTYAIPGQDTVTTETLTISTSGSFPPGLRIGVVEMIQTAMSASGVVVNDTANYYTITGPYTKNGQTTEGHSCTVSTAPAYIGLNYWEAENEGFTAQISVSISIGTPGSGFCDSSAGQASALTGAIAGTFGPIGVGIGATFGTISAVCSSSEGS